MMTEHKTLQCHTPGSSRFNNLRVVALGGGTGLPVVLRSLKNILFPTSSEKGGESEHERLTAIITVTDDGGSSGRLRKDFNMLPPGDIRNCLSALSEDSNMLSDLFQYRFQKGDGLTGHSLGNLLIAALTELKGNFMEAIKYCSKIMNVKGQILPLTPSHINLVARFIDGKIVKGESSIIKHNGKIKYVFLSPSYSYPLPAAVDAIEKAEAIVIGPGSLYTSIVPNLLVRDIVEAIKGSRAKKIYVCNLMTEPGETDGFSATDHIKTVLDHTEYGLLHYVLLNKKKACSSLQLSYMEKGYIPVKYNLEEIAALGLTSVVADVVSEKDNKIRHDEDKLGRLLTEII